MWWLRSGVGIAVVLTGVAELDLVVEMTRAARPRTRVPGGGRVPPVALGVLAIGLVAFVLVPSALPQATRVAALDR